MLLKRNQIIEGKQPFVRNLTVSGMYRSGMVIFSGTPNRLSIVFVLILGRFPLAGASLLLSKADLMTSGVLNPRGPRACSISKSSLDLADS